MQLRDKILKGFIFLGRGLELVREKYFGSSEIA